MQVISRKSTFFLHTWRYGLFCLRRDAELKLLIAYCCVINVVAFVLFGIDKRKAVHHQWRISEHALLASAILGGSIGAQMGMGLFHHKTRKKRFRIGVPVILLLQISVVLLCLSCSEWFG